MVAVSTDTAGNTAELRLSGGKHTVHRITPTTRTCCVPVGCGQEVNLKVFGSHALLWGIQTFRFTWTPSIGYLVAQKPLKDQVSQLRFSQ